MLCYPLSLQPVITGNDHNPADDLLADVPLSLINVSSIAVLV